MDSKATKRDCACNRTVAASRLKNTNLALIVSQSDSHCDLASRCASIKIAREPVEDADSGHAVCDADSGLAPPLFRRRPTSCNEGIDSNDGVVRKVTDCASNSASSSFSSSLAAVIILRLPLSMANHLAAAFIAFSSV